MAIMESNHGLNFLHALVIIASTYSATPVYCYKKLVAGVGIEPTFIPAYEAGEAPCFIPAINLLLIFCF